MGWPRFGYITNFRDPSLNGYIGFLPWLNDELNNDCNSITFYDLIKLLGENVIIENTFQKPSYTDFVDVQYYLKDYKMFIFGSNDFYDKSAAQEIQLKRSIKDVNTLVERAQLPELINSLKM